MRHIISIGAFLAGISAGARAQAQASEGAQGAEAQSSAGASLSLTGEGASASASSDVPETTGRSDETTGRSDVSYMQRYLPENDLWELGFFGGVMFPSDSHNLRDPLLPQQPFRTAGELGIRFAYYPLAFLGAEVEGAAMPSDVEDGSDGGLYAGRGHLIGQLPIASITPFVLFGGGVLGSTSTAMGTDADPALHFGGGVKAAIDGYLSLRLDVRDTLSQKYNEPHGTVTHHPEVLLGLTFTLERDRPDGDGDGVADHRDRCPFVRGEFEGCPAPDQDADGVPDEVDQCKDAGGVAPTGCPDTDGDGRLDAVDACPTEPADTKTGCPDMVCPCNDSDNDGLTDGADKCPDEAADTRDGCPSRDADGDGIADAADKCPDQAETKNDFQDDDGCPDEVPAEVQRFSGVIRGIEFAPNSDEIRAGSTPLLDDAAQVLGQYPDIQLEIVGHSDTQGSRELNVDLSRRRAESVRAYLVEQGVDSGRLSTRGAGPDEPIADNETEAGRQQNRRIEFKIVSK